MAIAPAFPLVATFGNFATVLLPEAQEGREGEGEAEACLGGTGTPGGVTDIKFNSNYGHTNDESTRIETLQTMYVPCFLVTNPLLLLTILYLAMALSEN